jgi:hypothetical protein
VKHVVAALLVLTALASFVGAQPQDAPVKPGWDVFPQTGSGKVTYHKPGNSDNLLLDFELKGAEPNQTYALGFDIFDLPEPGVPSFGVPRFRRGRFTREGVAATIDIFSLEATITTDANGNGKTKVRPPLKLDPTAVPAGTYNIQFWFSRNGRFPVYYRTGDKFGQGFAAIKR